MPTIIKKIIQKHLVEGVMERGKSTAIRVDQTLIQDATGTMTYLQLEAMGVGQVKADLSISYVDRNTSQSSFENTDDHKYLQATAMKYGVRFSCLGNGVCHQVHLERFAKPQTTPLGSDSHIPTVGGMGALVIGAGDLDIACAMAGVSLHLNMSNIINVWLHGSLTKGVSSKDIILKISQILSVKGGVENVIGCSGDGVRNLSIPQRAIITNMRARLGATTLIFPGDEATWESLKEQHREDAYKELKADEGAIYDTVIDINLSTLELMITMPHSLDSVLLIGKAFGLKVDQIAIGSCTNSSYMDMMSVAGILENKTVGPDVSLVISSGFRQVLHMVSQDGGLSGMISVGARTLESTCGPCTGTGQSLIANALSLHTFNRNFYGRSGTLSVKICLVFPETVTASTLCGYIVDLRTVEYELPQEPEVSTIDDPMIIAPDAETVVETEVVRGPNIKPLPINTSLEDRIDEEIVIKVGDNVTVGHIAPAGAKVLSYRSNIEKISEFIFMNVEAGFRDDCLEHGGRFIIIGVSHGQGGSRGCATSAPIYLGVKTVIAKSFARIHRINLVNFGVIPFTFSNEEDYDTIDGLDELTATNLKPLTEHTPVEVINITKDKSFQVFHSLAQRDTKAILAGGTLDLICWNQS